MAVNFQSRNPVFSRHFGESITHTTIDESSRTIDAVIETGDIHDERNPQAQFVAWVNLDDVTPAESDTLTFAGVVGVPDGDYRIVEIRKDGTNGAYLDCQFIRQ